MHERVVERFKKNYCLFTLKFLFTNAQSSVYRIIIATASPYPLRIGINRSKPNTQPNLPHHSFLSSHHPQKMMANSLNNSKFLSSNVRSIPSPTGYRSIYYLPTPAYQRKRRSLPHSPKTPRPPPSMSTLPNCPISPPLPPPVQHRILVPPDILPNYRTQSTAIPNYFHYCTSGIPPLDLDLPHTPQPLFNLQFLHPICTICFSYWPRRTPQPLPLPPNDFL